MNMFKKIIFAVLVIALLIISLCLILLRNYEGTWFFMAPGYNKTNRFLKNNFEELSYIIYELPELDYSNITIRKETFHKEHMYIMKAGKNMTSYETVPVPEEMISHISSLFENGVQVISYGNNSVNFTLWSDMDESRGLIYSVEGEKPKGEQLIKASQLSKNNWYYYVHNYEKAKAKNPEKFD